VLYLSLTGPGDMVSRGTLFSGDRVGVGGPGLARGGAKPLEWGMGRSPMVTGRGAGGAPVYRRSCTMKRFPVNKSKSASKFRKNVSHIKAINLIGAPMRGGIRL